MKRIIVGCKFASLTCIEGEPVQAFLRTLRKTENIGHRTSNHYLQSIHGFCNWCVTTKRMLANPLVGVERLNAAVDVRHQRRALTAEEVARMVAAARTSYKRVQGFSGEQRARIYLISFMTGLRRKEIASLTPRSFDLDASPPTLTVEAACSKHRRKDVLPLHPELVAMLREWLKGRRPTEKLFPGLENKKTWFMVKKDLKRAGIEYETAEGIADFHAAGRHSHITELLRNGTSLSEAKELARHSDVNMTMRYTHIGIDDQAKAVAKLPTPRRRVEPAADAAPENDPALQMRCIFCGCASHAVTFDGTDDDLQKRENPCGGKGFDASGHPLATSDKVEATGRQ